MDGSASYLIILRATISDWMPYISWSVVPVIISLVKKYKPAWKDKVGEFWPIIAVIICILLNSIGIKIKPTDLDLPPTAPPGITLSKPRTLDAMPAHTPFVTRGTTDTGSTPPSRSGSPGDGSVMGIGDRETTPYAEYVLREPIGTAETGSTAPVEVPPPPEAILSIRPDEVVASVPPSAPPVETGLPGWLKVLLFSIMGGLGSSKLYDEWKRRKLNKEACALAKKAATNPEG